MFNPPHWGIFITRPTGGGGEGLFRAPHLISETTGPILKIQAAFESPGKTVEGKQILLTSGSRVTSQVRSKSKCSTFRLGDIGEQNCDVKHKQSQLIGMDSIYDICKYHLMCFMTIIEVKVCQVTRVKKVKQKKS